MMSFFSYNRRQNEPAAQAPVQPQQPEQTRRPVSRIPQPPVQPQQPQQQTRRPVSRIPRPLPPPRLSNFSTPAVENSGWSSVDFMLGAGMVVIQPSTQRVVVVYETEKRYWFLPRGRKDVGESLEQTALREAYEETGYQAEFLPLLNPTHQPVAPSQRADSDWSNTEPIYITLTSWEPRKRRNGTIEPHGGEYLTMWYAGQIPEGVTPDEGTGMPDEQNFKSHLLTFDEALSHLWDAEKLVLAYVWRIFNNTEIAKRNMAAEAATTSGQPQQA